MRGRAPRDAGFTLIEMLTVVVIIGIIILPLGEFVRTFFANYPVTQARLADSHDIQITTAYFSEDVANTGVRGGDPGYAPQQSVWTTLTPGGFPGSYCGQGVGTPIVLLQWNDGTVSGAGGTEPVDSALYLSESGTLHRIYCRANNTTQSDAVMAHNFVAPAAGTSPVTCSAACGGSPPPTKITFTLSIKDSHDLSVVTTDLQAQRRQTPS